MTHDIPKNEIRVVCVTRDIPKKKTKGEEGGNTFILFVDAISLMDFDLFSTESIMGDEAFLELPLGCSFKSASPME